MATCPEFTALLSVRIHHRLEMQVGLAQMLKGGVIMDVTTVEEARIAEEAGAVAVMALERVPAGGVCSHPFRCCDELVSVILGTQIPSTTSPWNIQGSLGWVGATAEQDLCRS